MCFSAEVSFGAAAVITTVGVIAYKKADTQPLRFLALIPFFFGIQQFFEGIVWVSSMNENLSYLLNFSTFAFIFFAWIIWPIYIPFTMWKLETKVIQKRFLLISIFIGGLVISALAFVLLKDGVAAQIKDCSIDYKSEFTSKYAWVLGGLYFLVTTVPPMISSVKKVWILGVLNVITYSTTKVYYNEHVISVWCFLAAISSLAILWLIMSEKRNLQTKN